MTSIDESRVRNSVAIPAATFREVLGRYPTGVAVVTGLDPSGAPVGMTVGSFTSVSLDPPLVGFFPGRTSQTLEHIRAHGHFCVNVLAEDQESTCRTFARPDRGGVNPFATVPWDAGSVGAPVLREAIIAIECVVTEILPAGDHHFVLGHVVGLRTVTDSLPLLFYRGGYGRFSAPSLRAGSEGDTVRQLALADVGRPDMERLAESVSAACVLSALIGPDLVQLISAMPANSAQIPPPVGTRMPWIPPVGRVFAAGQDPAGRKRYLSSATPALGAEQQSAYERMFDLIRDRGWSIVLRHPQLDAAEAVMAGGHATSLSDTEAERVRRHLANIDAHEPETIDPAQSYDIRLIAAPVIGPSGSVELVLSLQQLAGDLPGERVQNLVRDLVATATHISDRLAHESAAPQR